MKGSSFLLLLATTLVFAWTDVRCCQVQLVCIYNLFRFLICVDEAAQKAAAEKVAQKVGLLKRNLLSAPLDDAVEKMLTGAAASKEIVVIPYRENDKIFIQRGSDRVIVHFQLYFTEADDRALSHVFLQACLSKTFPIF